MIKKIMACMLGSIMMCHMANAQCISRDENVERQVETVLSRLSLDEKIGQMCELTIDCVSPQRDAQDADKTAGGLLGKKEMERVFGQYKVGSILNVPNGKAVTPQQWAEMIRTLNKVSMEQCNGVPQLYGVDQIHGASYTWGATFFPQEIGQGASFNVNIPKRIGEITAYESRACLIPWVYSPVMDLARTPLWPRMWESFGEDVLLNGAMASQLVRGLQGDDPNHLGAQNVAACLKHYLAYGAPVSGKDRTPSSVTDREMYEKYFVPFRMCVEAGALSIMVNSANNNGLPFHCNHLVLTEWLKEGMDWDGMIVTDWADIDNIWQRDHVAANKKDAICLAINAGIDMTMDPYNTDFCTLLKELVQEGRVPMSRIDDAVRRIVRLKVRLGLLDPKTWDIDYGTIASKKAAKSKKGKKPTTLAEMFPDFACDQFAKEAVSMAEECMVLLKNDKSKTGNNVLPLKQGTKIFVCGPNANNFRTMNGGWSYTWQGDKTNEVCREIGKYKTFYEAIADKFGKDNVEFSEMVRYEGSDWQHDEQVPELLIENGNSTGDKIRRAEVIIACIGENTYTETPGNINDLTLSRNQIEMVNVLAKTGKPVILILNEGRPRLITDIEPDAAAIVQTFLPGNYGGEALANLLAGEANFSGRLPYTYPKYHGSFATYDYKPSENVATMNGAYNYDAKMDVLYNFGYGLSYSSVSYSNLRYNMLSNEAKPLHAQGNKVAGTEGKVLEFLVDVKNTGSVKTKEPVLLFISDMVASLTPDVKRLRAFDKVELEPGETRTVRLLVPVADLAFVNQKMKWVVEPGQFRAAVGGQSVIFEL